MPGTLVRDTRSTVTYPPRPRRRRTRAGPGRRCSGRTPTAISAWSPRPYGRRRASTRTPSPARSTDGGAGLVQDGHAPLAEHPLDRRRGVGVLVRHDPVAAGDQRDLYAHGRVCAGELGTGHTRPDDDQVVRQLGQVVHLPPVEDPLAVRHRGGQHPRGGAGGQQHQLGVHHPVRPVGTGDLDPVGGQARGITLFGVETEKEGYSVGRKLDKVGQPESDTAEMFFENLRCTDDDIIGELDGGFIHMMQMLPQERLGCAISNLAHAKQILIETLEYAKERKAFGQGIGSFQWNKFLFAEMFTKIDVTQSFIDERADSHSKKEATPIDAAKAKWWSSQVQNEVIDHCVQIHGGYGYMNEYRVARAWRDARVTKIWAGSNEIMREHFARPGAVRVPVSHVNAGNLHSTRVAARVKCQFRERGTRRPAARGHATPSRRTAPARMALMTGCRPDGAATSIRQTCSRSTPDPSSSATATSTSTAPGSTPSRRREPRRRRCTTARSRRRSRRRHRSPAYADSASPRRAVVPPHHHAPRGFVRDRVLLHFGAVDQMCRVWVNDVAVGEHEGGYWAFHLDVTDALRPGDNTLVVAVRDLSDGHQYATGKQRLNRGAIWYTAQSGIWQTVWLESVPETWVGGLT